MYPSGELARLARRKTALRQRIAATRLRCIVLAGEAARPVHWIDRAIAQWRRISPFAKLAALPLGLLFRRRILHRKSGFINRLFALLPVVLRGVRTFRAHRARTAAA